MNKNIIYILWALCACGRGEGGGPTGPANDQPEWFKHRPWTIQFSASESEERRQAICSAAEIWNSLDDQPFFTCDPDVYQPVASAPTSFDKMIAFEEDESFGIAFSVVWAFTQKSVEIPAFTTLVTDGDALVEADVYFNDLQFIWTDRSRPQLPQGGIGVWDIQSVALHELGHWIFGPDHVSEFEDPRSVMRDHFKETTVHIQPSSGDIERLRSRLEM